MMSTPNVQDGPTEKEEVEEGISMFSTGFRASGSIQLTSSTSFGQTPESDIDTKSENRDNSSQSNQISGISTDKPESHSEKIYPTHNEASEPPPPSVRPSLDFAVTEALKNEIFQRSEFDQPDNKKEEVKVKRLPPRARICPRKVTTLPPLPKNFYKKMTYWTGSEFVGEFKDGQFSLGVFKYPTGTKYESEFKDGQIETDKHLGRITFPRGDVFEGQWKNGRFVSGHIIFHDGLEYTPGEWDYLTPKDRRFHWEKMGREPPDDGQTLPGGLYDIGERLFDPANCSLTDYEGQFIRKVTQEECCLILENCRSGHCTSKEYFHRERLPGPPLPLPPIIE